MKQKPTNGIQGCKEKLALDLKDIDQTAKVCKALSSQTRLEILRCIVNTSMTISQLSEIFMLPMSSICLHIKTLKEAGLIETYPKPGLHGTKKLCDLVASEISIDLYSSFDRNTETPPVYVEMPVGYYSSCDITPPCGLAASDFYLTRKDSPFGFFTTERYKAGILWFTKGQLEYQFPNLSLQKDSLKEVEFSFEMCSEAPGFNNDWPSDVDFELNHTHITTIHLNGDYGGRRGVYNPSWWSDRDSQYGDYIAIHITHNGCFMNQKKVSDETIESLNLKDGYYLSFILKCSVNGESSGGGMNLFGKQFGDYNQGIVMKVEYE